MPSWILNLVMGTWPRAARERHGRALAQTLESGWRAAGRERFARRIRERIAIVFDAVAAGLAERRAARSGPAPASRGSRRSGVLHGAAGDARHAWRRVRARPGSACLAVLMLATAVGMTAAMFTVLDALVLHPVPFRDPDRLVSPRLAQGGRFITRTSPDLIRAWRASPGFDAVHGWMAVPLTIEGGAEPVSRSGAVLTPGTFEMLGVAPIRGRSFAAGDGQAGTDDLVIVSEALWRSYFAADPDVVGRRIQLSGESVVIVGVMPAGFRFPLYDTQIWRPLDLDAPGPAVAARALVPTARISPGVPREDAARLAAEAMHAADPSLARYEVTFRPLTSGFLDRYAQRAIVVLAAGAAAVFLALCANVANLLLGRLAARTHEFGVCSALGASRGRLLREALFEHAMLGVTGCAAGLAIAAGLVSLARAWLPGAFLLRTLNPIDLDLRAAAAAGLLGLAATLLAGIVPAWLGSRASSGASLRLQDRASTVSRNHLRAARAMLAVEIVLAMALLTGAATLLRSFVNLASADRGLDTTGVVAGLINLPRHVFTDHAGRLAFAETLETEMRRLPGVTAATVSQGLPPSAAAMYFGEWQSDAPGLPSQNLEINVYGVEPGFFDFFGIRLLEGRLLSRVDAPEAVVITESLARRLWPGGTAVGRWFGQDGPKEFQVAGVVNDIRSLSVDPRRDRFEMFRSTRVAADGQVTARVIGAYVNLAVRCAPCPPIDTIRRSIHAADARVVVERLRPMDEDYLEALAQPRAAAALGTAFAATAMFAAAGGLFSILSYTVTRRRRELGIRAAMGARPSQLRRLVVADGLRLAAAGVTLGAVPAWMVTRSLASLAYEVTPGDPLTWAAVVGLIAVTTLAATWHPARRAMRADPVRLLRQE